ncbi:MAG: hypothetical protein JO235_16930 [Chroococcidiopsidaceae cyanobacterium CP_BM_RX_35]|nr:hypothetical protein [Chroococcidiopsidaceae cyanobacterium CP_BM_RX_35]
MFGKFICQFGWSVCAGVLMQLMPVGVLSALCLPPPGDIPEEILRTEIITQARSPVNGKPLTAAEYVQLQTQISISSSAPTLSSDVRQNIFLLRLLKLIRTFAPFLPLPK